MGQILSGTNTVYYLQYTVICILSIYKLYLYNFMPLLEFALLAVDVAHAVVNHTAVPADAHSVHKCGGM